MLLDYSAIRASPYLTFATWRTLGLLLVLRSSGGECSRFNGAPVYLPLSSSYLSVEEGGGRPSSLETQVGYPLSLSSWCNRAIFFLSFFFLRDKAISVEITDNSLQRDGNRRVIFASEVVAVYRGRTSEALSFWLAACGMRLGTGWSFCGFFSLGPLKKLQRSVLWWLRGPSSFSFLRRW